MSARASTSNAKRALDITLAAVALVLLAPILIAVAIAVRIALGSPVLFRHERPGMGERRFTMYKFRTMREPRAGEERYVSDAQRLTAFGTLLRRTSLDELPELWNVLRGDMSLVGPRPLLTRYTPFFRPTERRRFAVRPGITGLAQVRGRNHARWDDRLALDTWYVDHWSMALDLRILAESAWAVLSAKDVAADPRTLMLNLDEERARYSEPRAS